MFETSVLGIGMTAILVIVFCFAGVVNPDSISVYTGTPVVAINNVPLTAFQLNGMIVGSAEILKYQMVLDHEKGHSVQQQEDDSFVEFIVTVAIPSMVCACLPISFSAYHKLPWEAEADKLVGIEW